MRKKELIGPLLLSGLIIGPILGSGIIILPSLAWSIAGAWALPAWLLIITIGMLFAWIFCRLSLLYPGSGGISTAIEHAFGGAAGELASLYLIGAVFFGPVAVMLTAGTSLPHVAISPPRLAMLLTVASGCILLHRVSCIGWISLVFSSLTALALFAGGINTLIVHGLPQPPAVAFSGTTFSYTLLLLFWSVVGWEIIGNYSGEVAQPERTLPKAVAGSAMVIAVVTLTVVSALQTAAEVGGPAERISVSAIVAGLFGQAGPFLVAVISVALCSSTYLLFVGGVSRLIAALAEKRVLPSFLSGRSRGGAPRAALLLLVTIHLLLLLLVDDSVMDIEQLVAVADGFFLAYSLLGVLAAARLLTGGAAKGVACFLALILVTILLRSSWPVLSVVVTLAAAMWLRAGTRAASRSGAGPVAGP